MDQSNDVEMVAWVDEDENLIKVIPRTLANSDPKYLHSEIAVLIVDIEGRVLLQQRAKTKKVAPGIWAVIAGHITYGDTQEESVYQELLEEMGLDARPYTYLFRESVALPNERHYCHWYIGLYRGGEVVIQPKEVDDFAWVREAEYSKFSQTHDMSVRTDKMLKRFWAGEWDNLIGGMKNA